MTVASASAGRYSVRAVSRRSSFAVAELLPAARTLSDEDFFVLIGRPRAVLVGSPPSSDDVPISETRASTPSPRAHRPSEFVQNVVLAIPGATSPGLRIRVGRCLTSQVRIDDDSVSKNHAVLQPLRGGGYAVEDLQSLNGTLVEGALVLPGRRVVIAPGQTLQIGSRVFKLYEPDRLLLILRTFVREKETAS